MIIIPEEMKHNPLVFSFQTLQLSFLINRKMINNDGKQWIDRVKT